jgi:polar amino acid transport system substrate-binding protein
MNTRISILSILLHVLSPILSAAELTLVTVENSADTATGEAVLVEAYRKLDVDLVIKRYPAERAIRMAVAGLVDGEVQRIDSVRIDYPTLIQVKPAINSLEASVFSRSIEIRPTGWESLRPYRIGLIRGIQFAENNTVGLNRHLINGYRSLFKMLENGRIDLAVAPRLNGLVHIRHSEIRTIHELTPPVARFELFHYLHPKNGHLVSPVSKILADMKENGELERIRDRVNLELVGHEGPHSSSCPNLPACGEGVASKTAGPESGSI